MQELGGIIVSKEEIRKRTIELGKQISLDYKNKELILIGVLKGGFVFLADLMREINIPIDIDFMSISSYGTSTKSSGIVKIIKDIDVDISNKHVLIVEDIVDTGLTLNYLRKFLSSRGPQDIKICAIFDKPSRRKIEVEVEYKGIEIPNKFVVGYGLDCAEKYRNLADVYEFKSDT